MTCLNYFTLSFVAVLIQEGLDGNLTGYLINLVQCAHGAEIDWYSDGGCKFAHCNSCHDCKETSGANHLEPVFRDRLQYTRGSLLLTGIQASDDGLELRVKVRMKASRKSVVAVAESLHLYTIRIFVKRSENTDSSGICSD